jgi:hypothetical protein
MEFHSPFLKRRKLEYILIALILIFLVIPLVTLVFFDYQKILPVKQIVSNFFFR